MDRVWGPVTSYHTLPTPLLQYAAPQPRARHRSCHLQITKSWLLTRTAAQKPECQRAPAEASIRLFKWFETVGKRRGWGVGGVFASEPQRRQSSNLQWNGKKRKERNEKGGGRSGSMASSSVIPPKGQDFCRWNWEEQQNCRCTEQQGIFRCHDQLRRAPLKHICQ